MANPTEADIQDQIGKAIKMFEEVRNFGHVNSPNVLQMEGDIIASLEGDYSPEVASAWSTVRAGYANLMEQPGTLLTPLLRTYAQFIGTPETDPQSILTRLFDHFTDNTLTVKSRDFTFGTLTAGGSNVGTGTVNRLTVDENGDDIENQTADSKTVECIGDEHSGAAVEGEERFNIRGETALRDRIEIAGSGLSAEIRAVTARDSRQLIQNPSFDQFTGSVGSVTAFGGWTPTTNISNFDANVAYYRNPFGSSTTPYSLKILGNDTLSQNFSVKRTTFNPNVPVYLQIAYNRQTGSGTGTLTLHLGSQSTAVVLAAETGWNVLRIALGTKNWFKTWNKEDPTVAIQLSGSSGYVLVDDIVMYPMSNFDGAWYAVVGGATPFLRDDIFTWTDTEVGSIIQRWFWRTYNRYLPHSGSPSWSDPSTIDPTPTPTPSPTPTPT